jgi:hypothetical protein
MSDNVKLMKLIAYLGVLSEYELTGLVFTNNSKTPTSYRWKNHSYEASDFEKIPDILSHCSCGTKITNNCLIRHIPSGRLEFIGLVCAKYININFRTCITCHKPNLCRTKLCADCRKLCKVNSDLHEENNVVQTEFEPVDLCEHDTDEDLYSSDEEDRYPLFDEDLYTYQEEQCIEKLIEHGIEESKPFNERLLEFGKYKNESPVSLLGRDDGYIHYLLGSDYLTSYQRESIAELLPLTAIQFGKFRHKTFKWLKHNQSGYYNWIKANIEKPYVAYL